jgi:DNA polymerase elongation subunit (family B)
MENKEKPKTFSAMKMRNDTTRLLAIDIQRLSDESFNTKKKKKKIMMMSQQQQEKKKEDKKTAF